MDMDSIILQVLRWAHVFFGIVWIGHLYFFNFVQGHFEKALNADQKKIVVPNLRGRAIWWFRWGAMITFLTGVAYVIYHQFVATQPGAENYGFQNWFSTSSGRWITFGGLLGTIMWFNVWFVIWPRQKVIIPSVAGLIPKPADFDQLVATAGKFSRINTYLSVPMLFGMGARSHFAMKTAAGDWIAMLVVLAVGFGIAYHVVNGVAGKVGKEFVPPAPPPAPPVAPPAPK